LGGLDLLLRNGSEESLPNEMPSSVIELNLCHPDEVEGNDLLRFFCTLFHPMIPL